MFTQLFLNLQSFPKRLKAAWTQNRFAAVQSLATMAALVVFLLNRIFYEWTWVDFFVIVGIPFFSYVGTMVRLLRQKKGSPIPFFEAMVLHPVKTALWFQLFGSVILLWTRTSLGPDAFDELFLWIFVLPVEWILVFLFQRRAVSHTALKLSVVALVVFAVSFLFFTLSATA